VNSWPATDRSETRSALPREIPGARPLYPWCGLAGYSPL